MPRNTSGVYALPAGNPVVPGTLIESVWANTTMADVAAALTASLPRDGGVGMTGPLILFRDGQVPLEAATFGQLMAIFTDPEFVATTAQGFKITGTTLQAAMALITLAATGGVTISAGGTLTLTGVTLTDLSASGEVKLPANTSVGPVGAAEIAALDGVTGNVQGQLDAKVDESDGTANNLALTGVPTAPTAAPGTNNDQVANTAFAVQLAFQAALPVQAGNGGKFVTTNGINARWDYVPLTPSSLLSVT